MRNWIQIAEGASVELIQSGRQNWLSEMYSSADIDSIQAALEDYESDEDELIEMWFDTRLAMFKHMLSKGVVPIYRTMRVENFKQFISGLKAGSTTLGAHWSLHPIDSPTWDQDHVGDVEVSIQGRITTATIDWESTLRQQFEWPHELEVIFEGPVMVDRITNEVDDSVFDVGGAPFPK